MNKAAYLRYLALIRTTRPRRYRALFETIYQHAARKIVEIGVFNGVHALQMIRTATLHHPPGDIHYFGFDLFEELTPDLLQSEFSKKAPPCAAVQRKLEKTGATIRLFKGDSKLTLPNAVPTIGEVDFAFIDGGHSVETIQSDWKWVQKLMGDQTIVLFDDYYRNTEPEMEGLGCQGLIDGLDRGVYEIAILEPTDVFRKKWGRLRINMVMVSKNARSRPDVSGGR